MPLLSAERVAFAAIAEALQPFDDAAGPTPSEVADGVACYLESVAPPLAAVVRAIAATLELSPIVSLRPRRLSAVPLAERRSILHAWETSRAYPQRFAVLSLKVLFGLAYFRDRRARARVKYGATAASCATP